MKDFNERRDEILLNLESVGNNLSNFEKVVPLIIAKASDLRSLWRDGNYETKRKIEYLVYPNGIFWNKKNRSYRTENRNSVFDLLDVFWIKSKSMCLGIYLRKPVQEILNI